MQRLIIPDLWIPLSGLLWSWYRIPCRRSRYFCVWMIQWYPIWHKIWKCFKTVWPCRTQRFQLSEWTLLCECHALRNLSGIGIKYLIFPFLLAIVCGRKKHHWTRPEVTVWNTFHCCYIRFAGILKQATMNRKRSGLFVTIWCEAAKGLKCLSIWLTSVTVPWKFCPIRTNIFLSTVQKAYRSFVLN